MQPTTLTLTSKEFTSLPSEINSILHAAGITNAYLYGCRSGRARPDRLRMGEILTVLTPSYPAEAERLLRAYILDAVPPRLRPHLEAAWMHAPLILAERLPEPTTDPITITAIANLRQAAASDADIRECIIMLAKYL